MVINLYDHYIGNLNGRQTISKLLHLGIKLSGSKFIGKKNYYYKDKIKQGDHQAQTVSSIYISNNFFFEFGDNIIGIEFSILKW